MQSMQKFTSLFVPFLFALEVSNEPNFSETSFRHVRNHEVRNFMFDGVDSLDISGGVLTSVVILE